MKRQEQTTRAFKHVTISNWLLADGAPATAVGGTDWIEYVNSLTFAPGVPRDVYEAFQSAAGAIGYAYFYYPIFTLASQQILRVADFAVDKVLEMHRMPKPRSFAERLELLKSARLISATAFHRWDGIRRLRNEATHPQWQEHWGESMSLRMIGIVAEAISTLPWPKT
jgi:hypothetical protein